MKVEDLVDEVLTKQEGELFIQALEERMDGGKTDTSFKKLPLYLAQKLTRLDGEMNLAVVYDKFRIAFFKKPYVGLTLAFEPSKEFLRDVAKWLEDNLGNKVILDLEVDEGIIGGAKISCNDHYRDYSVLAKIEGKASEKTLQLGQVSTLI